MNIGGVPIGVWLIGAAATFGLGIWGAKKLRSILSEAKAQLFTAPSLVATLVHDLVIGAVVAMAIGARMVYLGIV